MLAMTITCLYWTLGTPHQKGWTALLHSVSSLPMANHLLQLKVIPNVRLK